VRIILLEPMFTRTPSPVHWQLTNPALSRLVRVLHHVNHGEEDHPRHLGEAVVPALESCRAGCSALFRRCQTCWRGCCWRGAEAVDLGIQAPPPAYQAVAAP
jgi:hypothetical protein